MVLETLAETGSRKGTIGRIPRQLGIGDQSLRKLGRPGRNRWSPKGGLRSAAREKLTRLQKKNLRSRRTPGDALTPGGLFFSLWPCGGWNAANGLGTPDLARSASEFKGYDRTDPADG
jgi:hypothetical protein